MNSWIKLLFSAFATATIFAAPAAMAQDIPNNPIRCSNRAFAPDACAARRQAAIDSGCITAAFAAELAADPTSSSNGGWFPMCDPFDGIYLGKCPCGCFAPDAQILSFDVESGETNWTASSVIVAGDSRKAVATVADDATLSQFALSHQSVALTSVGDEKGMLVALTLENGRKLRVTNNHPMLISTGEMVRARELTRANKLIGFDGAAVKITRVDRENYEGKVYNLATSGTTEQSHMIVAEGVVVGDLQWQNLLEEEEEAIAIRE